MERNTLVTHQDDDCEAHLSETVHEEEVQPQLTLWGSIALFIMAALMVVQTAESLVNSIDEFSSTSGISKEFISLIMLPIVSNVNDHLMVLMKKSPELSICTAVEKTTVSPLPSFWYGITSLLPSSKSWCLPSHSSLLLVWESVAQLCLTLACLSVEYSSSPSPWLPVPWSSGNMA